MKNYHHALKAFILLFICFALVIGCASTNNATKSNTAYSSYKQYSNLLNDKNDYSSAQTDKLFSFLSPRYQTEILNTRPKNHALLNQLIKDYLAFPLLINKEVEHIEKISDNMACLMINGISKDNEKIAFYLTYIKKNEWLIDYIKIEHMADYNQYLSEANCDSQRLDALRFKEMMAQ